MFVYDIQLLRFKAAYTSAQLKYSETFYIQSVFFLFYHLNKN